MPRRYAVTVLVLFAVIVPLVASPASASEERPNIVFMMMDNLGWGEIGAYGGGILRGTPTPRLDALAEEGLRLLNFNVEPQCTPTRSAFMTGRHPIRSGTTMVVWGMLYGMTQWERTIAEVLSDAGYATGMFGKWHLGDIPGRLPIDQGFDEWYGIPNTTDESLYASHPQYDSAVGKVPQIMEGVKGQPAKVVGDYDIEARRAIDAELTRRTIDFMSRKSKSGEPFFAFVPFTQPHIPTLPHDDFDGQTGHGPYSDVLAEIDHRAGQVLDAIDDLGIRDHTIVIWTSDNGPEELPPYQGTAGFWRGHYFTVLEGSLRTSFLMRWPGQIEPGRVSDEIVHIVDMLPTLARVGDGEVPQDRTIDGVDQLDFLLGAQERSNREGFPAYNGNEMFAYKWRDWKVHFVRLDTMRGAPERLNIPQVFNLISDPKELYDLVGLDQSVSWILPPVFERVVAFQGSLVEEPPIQLGTPDPYEPPN
jgi:arylsulfatase